MKKVLGLILVSVLALSVVACTKKKDETAPVAPETAAPATAPTTTPAEAPAQK